MVEKKVKTQPWSEKQGQELLAGTTKLNPKAVKRFRLMLNLLGSGIQQHEDIGHFITDPEALQNHLGDKYEGRIWPKAGETMIGIKRLQNLENCILDIVKNRIPGDLIETGVWCGGACIFMRSVLKELEENDRIVWLADSFEGLPKPDSSNYPEDAGDNLHSFKELAITESEVRNNFKKYKLLDDQVMFLKGWFKDTMPTAPIEKLAILRLDGDMYESTIDVLFYLYPKLSVGGYCIIDDWEAVPACRKAVEDYRKKYEINEKIHTIDWTGVFWKKEKEIKTNQTR